MTDVAAVQHPSHITSEASIVLDVQIGKSSRPMRFPLLCTVREIVEMIQEMYPHQIPSPAFLFLPRSGIWLRSRCFLYSYYLENLEAMRVETNRNQPMKQTWSLLLPNGKVTQIKAPKSSTVRGLIQIMRRKPLEFNMGDIEVVAEQTDGNRKTLPLDRPLESLGLNHIKDQLILLGTDNFEWKTLASSGGSAKRKHIRKEEKKKSSEEDEIMPRTRLRKASHPMSSSPKNSLLNLPVGKELLFKSCSAAEIRDTLSSSSDRDSISAPTDEKGKPVDDLYVETEKVLENEVEEIYASWRIEPPPPKLRKERKSEPSLFNRPNKPIFSTVGDTIGTSIPDKVELIVNVLIQHTESTVVIYCEQKQRISWIFEAVLSHLDMSFAIGSANFGLFLPTQRQQIPLTTMIKNLHLVNMDLLIFKHVFPKKKKQRKGFSLPRNRFSGSKGSVLSITPEIDVPTTNNEKRRANSLFDSTTEVAAAVDIDILLQFITWMKSKEVDKASGIFRISASSSKIHDLLLCAQTIPGYYPEDFTVIEIGGAFKRYLGQCKPIIPSSTIPDIIATYEGGKIDKEKLWANIQEFPEESKQLLCILLPFIYNISLNHMVNLMTIENLSIIFSPILLQDLSTTIDLKKTGILADATTVMIQFGDRLRSHCEDLSSPDVSSDAETSGVYFDVPMPGIEDIERESPSLHSSDVETRIPAEGLRSSSALLTLAKIREQLNAVSISSKEEGILALDAAITNRNSGITYLLNDFDKEEILKLLFHVTKCASASINSNANSS